MLPRPEGVLLRLLPPRSRLRSPSLAPSERHDQRHGERLSDGARRGTTTGRGSARRDRGQAALAPAVSTLRV